MKAVEAVLLDRLADSARSRAPGGVFIVAAPRTGSTVIYQALIRYFGLPYISNLTNRHFFSAPIVGISIQKAVATLDDIGSVSSFGKTQGEFGPSEGSAVMAEWFGGGHPSEILSTRALEDKESHLLKTFTAVRALTGRPLLVKNAWNCFRIPYLSTALKGSAFIWVRRDIVDAAASDLNARVEVHGDPTIWNSATPANVTELRKLPHWQQVVENQRSFHIAMERALAALPPTVRTDLWYEDFCADPALQLERLSSRLDALRDIPSTHPDAPVKIQPSGNLALDPADRVRIDEYVSGNRERFSALRFRGRRAP